ncbi:MAG: T9SS type A sorting domain-containing protein [Flavobacteriales bacterium]
MKQRTTALAGFVLVALSATAQNVTGYEYWIDEGHVNRITVNVAPTLNLNVTISPSYPTLSVGYHDLHMRLRQVVAGEVHWSSVASRRFWNYAGGPWEIIAVRYWTDASANPSDMQIKYFDTPQTDIDYQSFLEACDLLTTNNWLFLQLLDNHGQWSVVTVKPLDVVPVTVPPTPTDITAGALLCTGDTVTFTGTPGIVVAPAAIPTDFAWELVSGAGWILLGSDSLTAQLIVGTGTAQIRFRGINSCSVGSWYPESFSPVPLPLQPSLISGDLTVCEGQTGLSYSVTSVPGITYQWSVTGGWVDSGTGLPFLTDAGTSDATLSVIPYNVCGDPGPPRVDTIEVTTAPIQPVIGGDLEFCDGDSSLLSITPIGGETYLWSTGSVTSETWVFFDGSISVTASTGPECVDETASVNVVVPALSLGPITGPNSVLIMESDTFSVAAIPDADTYVWDPLPSGFVWGADPDMTDESAILNIVGPIDTVTLCVHAVGGGCEGDSVCIVIGIDGTVGSEDVNLTDAAMSLFPNPTSGLVYLGHGPSFSAFNLRVTDAMGRSVLVPRTIMTSTVIACDFSALVPGVYFVQFSDKNQSETRRLVVQR